MTLFSLLHMVYYYYSIESRLSFEFEANHIKYYDMF